MAGLGFDDSMPGVISAKTHGIIDYIHAGTNLTLAAVLRNRDRAASNAALALGLGVLVNALMTDYPLGVFRVWSFKTHGMMDYGVAAASAAIPSLVDMNSSAASTFFQVQGAGETGIAALTNYDDNSGSSRARKKGVTKLFQKRKAA